MGYMQQAIDAYAVHRDEAERAFALYVVYCGGKAPRRVTGMDTGVRLAFRISRGFTIEQAAAREYTYRWHLAILAPDQCGATGRISNHSADRNRLACSFFGTPHTIGM